MTDSKKNGFQTVEMNMEEYEAKLKEHRRKIARRMVQGTIALLLVITAVVFYFSLKKYDSYEVKSSIERHDSPAAVFKEFQGTIIKYSNDGVFCTNTDYEPLWGQSYEMAQPTMDECGGYFIIYDKGGNQIYIMTTSGVQGNIETTMTIRQVCVANQGTVAVLMEENHTAYIRLYDRNGTDLASGEIHGEKGGYPIALALSSDAQKMAISMIDINDGDIKTTIAFYNFGSVGQNEIDNCVGSYSYSDEVFPELEFVSDTKMIAFGSKEIALFEGTQKPEVSEEIFLDKEVKSIFQNTNYFGIVTNKEEEEVMHHLTVYNMKGAIVMERDFSMDYTAIEFLSNNEICIRNKNACEIYTIHGIFKFHYNFDKELYQIISGETSQRYLFLLDGVTEKVKLK